MSILTNWTEHHTNTFQKGIMTFGHGLNETGLFTDEALSALIEKHPMDRLDVCSMGASDHPLYPNKFRTGDFRGIDGKTLIDAAKAGRIWINLRKAMNIHPEYKAVLDQMYGGISEQTGNQTFNANGGILISSPVAKVPYHFDKTETILWHIRGLKRIYIYPQNQDFIPDKAYESVISDDIADDLPYKKDFDSAAQAFDLEPGQAICWPLNAPHRVDNSEFCVSVTTEYSTRESGMKNAAMLANATLRTKLGLNPSFEKDGKATRYVKSILGRALRKTGVAVDTTPADMVTFKIDPSAPDFIVDVDPYERHF